MIVENAKISQASKVAKRLGDGARNMIVMEVQGIKLGQVGQTKGDGARDLIRVEVQVGELGEVP